MPDWLLSLLKWISSLALKVVYRFRSKRRVKKRLENPSQEEIMVLQGAYIGTKNSKERIFSWTQNGGGLDPLESHLHFLLDEGVAVKLKREELGNRKFCQWYRLKSWFYDYLEEHPELRTIPEQTAT